MFTVKSRGDFKKTEKFLREMSKRRIKKILQEKGQLGIEALESATPRESGITAGSWQFDVVVKGGTYSLVWSNSHLINGVPLAILLQYGHGTGTGGYVEGRDFINSAIRPIFDRIADDVWKMVKSA